MVKNHRLPYPYHRAIAVILPFVALQHILPFSVIFRITENRERRTQNGEQRTENKQKEEGRRQKEEGTRKVRA